MALFTSRPSTARHRLTNPASPPPNPRDVAARLIADLGQSADAAQTAAITALAHLHAEDAPAIQWTLTDNAQVPPRLEGLIHPRTTDPGRYQRHAMAAWQRVIGAGPVLRDPARGGGERLTITGSYLGVAVIVGTTVAGDQR